MPSIANKPPLNQQITTPNGFPNRYFRDFLYELWDRSGGIDGVDKLAEKLTTAGQQSGVSNDLSNAFSAEIFQRSNQPAESITFQNTVREEISNINLSFSQAGKPQQLIEKKIKAIEARLTSIESDIADHETRISTLETESLDYESRITALEA